MTEEVHLPDLGVKVPVEPYSIEDHEDTKELFEILCRIAADRVQVDGFEQDEAKELTITDLTRIVAKATN